VIYNHELSGGVSVHTAGWGILWMLAKRQELKKKTIYEFEFTQIQSPERSKANDRFSDFHFSVSTHPSRLCMESKNNFYLLNASLGRQFMLAERAERSGVEVGLKVIGGLSLGLLKPILSRLTLPG